jgi:hypothetical protein
MVMTVPRRVLVLVLACVIAGASAGNRAGRAAAEPLAPVLSDRAYWQLIADCSEPNGSFRSENLVSNERTYQFVIPALLKTAVSGGVYLGVAPDQNFTYILALRPRLAFILDIRRGNLLEHLMYKALFELSDDRAAFLARLFSRPRPPGLRPDMTPAELFRAFDGEAPSDALFAQNLTDVRRRLETGHGFPLSAEDGSQLEMIYSAFLNDGPDLRYTAAPTFAVNGANRARGGYSGFAFQYPDFPSYAELQEAADASGLNRGYLANEANFQFLKQFETHNLLVPVVGDFGGPKALRAIGEYIRAHGATVSAFYVSNVEQYLMEDGAFDAFARNVATLPTDAHSTFIRSVWSRYGYQGGLLGPDGRASALDPIRAFVRDAQAGKIQSYYDVNARSR